MKLLCEINMEKQQNEIMPKVCQRRDMAVGEVLAHKHEDPGLTPHSRRKAGRHGNAHL